ncbi:hypothetical protein BK138_32190 [Paenibacillus rhizosphaerae]|uniref:HNH endonuclease n=1 Tax=Paenibacillus rhizosphaerae TaxID=297318 RepID=A0A1R1E663_9BACL|nr:HNH endonuclease [Paenibacillus rhizosphaerae]OMF47298.1 hypothetical protein BK138_32190 [Paenibacillus rhizosphaerae]
MNLAMISEVKEVPTERFKNCPLGKLAERYTSDKPMSEFDKPLAMNLTEGVSTESYPEDGIRQVPTRNQHLEGSVHPETGVPFEAKVITLNNGEQVEVVVPEFESKQDVQLPDELLEASDKDQFAECNRQLIEAVENEPELAAQFTDEQLEQLMDGETPDGYTWHHDAEKGKMQLLDSEIHAKTGHTGGKVFWGGGKDNR